MGLGAGLVLTKYFAYALVLCCLASPATAAGIQLLDSDPGLAGAIWYPCTAEPKLVPLGVLAPPAEFGLTGVKDCPVTGAKLPLVIFSHGRGGWFGANHDTEEALADAGFIVAAINHPGDHGNDLSRRDDLSVFGSRPVALSIKTFAEGIEQQEELALLREQDCDNGQGFLFARPLDPEEAESFLRDFGSDKNG